MVNCSIFNKVTAKVDTTTHTDNLKEARMKKANELYDSQCLFKTKIKPTDKSISPLVSGKLDQKQRKVDSEDTAGKNWGYMKKVELTDEIKADLRALKLRN